MRESSNAKKRLQPPNYVSRTPNYHQFAPKKVIETPKNFRYRHIIICTQTPIQELLLDSMKKSD